MEKTVLLIVMGILFSFPQLSEAQKVTLKSGSLEFIKNLSEIRVEYTYNDMMVGKYKEDDYIAKKVKEYNSKEPGKGDTWKETWISDRTTKFQPRFEEAFNNFFVFASMNFKTNQNTGGNYKMIVHTSFTEPGFNIYMTSKNASINIEVMFFDASNAEVARVVITNSPGSGIFELDYDTGIRIQEAYANAGRELAAFIAEKVFVK
jgi:hypothetical protein